MKTIKKLIKYMFIIKIDVPLFSEKKCYMFKKNYKHENDYNAKKLI
jgi:hypothetical protein